MSHSGSGDSLVSAAHVFLVRNGYRIKCLTQSKELLSEISIHLKCLYTSYIVVRNVLVVMSFGKLQFLRLVGT